MWPTLKMVCVFYADVVSDLLLIFQENVYVVKKKRTRGVHPVFNVRNKVKLFPYFFQADIFVLLGPHS